MPQRSKKRSRHSKKLRKHRKSKRRSKKHSFGSPLEKLRQAYLNRRKKKESPKVKEHPECIRDSRLRVPNWQQTNPKMLAMEFDEKENFNWYIPCYNENALSYYCHEGDELVFDDNEGYCINRVIPKFKKCYRPEQLGPQDTYPLCTQNYYEGEQCFKDDPIVFLNGRQVCSKRDSFKQTPITGVIEEGKVYKSRQEEYNNLVKSLAEIHNKEDFIRLLDIVNLGFPEVNKYKGDEYEKFRVKTGESEML